MGRKTDYKAKEEILEKVISTMSQNGLNTLSLRGIAQEIGVSARMLIYHFESYDALINLLFIHLSTIHKSILKNLMAENEDKTFVEVSQIFIESIYSAENKKKLILFLELYMKALRDPDKYYKFFDEVLHNWINEVESMIAPECGNKSRLYATMIMSFYRGLMLDWLATKDIGRIYETNNVFNMLIADLMKERPKACN